MVCKSEAVKYWVEGAVLGDFLTGAGVSLGMQPLYVTALARRKDTAFLFSFHFFHFSVSYQMLFCWRNRSQRLKRLINPFRIRSMMGKHQNGSVREYRRYLAHHYWKRNIRCHGMLERNEAF